MPIFVGHVRHVWPTGSGDNFWINFTLWFIGFSKPLTKIIRYKVLKYLSMLFCLQKRWDISKYNPVWVLYSVQYSTQTKSVENMILQFIILTVNYEIKTWPKDLCCFSGLINILYYVLLLFSVRKFNFIQIHGLSTYKIVQVNINCTLKLLLIQGIYFQ